MSLWQVRRKQNLKSEKVDTLTYYSHTDCSSAKSQTSKNTDMMPEADNNLKIAEEKVINCTTVYKTK